MTEEEIKKGFAFLSYFKFLNDKKKEKFLQELLHGKSAEGFLIIGYATINNEIINIDDVRDLYNKIRAK